MAGTSRDIVVVGAGIVGCLTGYLLAKQGAKVTILERDSVASHASGFAFGEMGALEGAGIPDPLLEFSLWCNRRHQTLAEELKEVSGNDSQFRICNRLTLAFDQPAVDQAKQSLQWQAKVADFSSQWLDTAQVLEVEPRVNPECLGGVLVQGAGSVEPYRYTLAAAQAGEKLGVEMALRRVTGLLTQGDRCCGVSFEGGQRAADAVVLAMGPWTEEASSWCQAPIPLVPLKGQILRLQLAGEPLRTSLHWGGSYAASKPDGLVWAGTTEEQVGFDEATTTWGRDKIMADLLRMAPSLGSAELLHQTACLRPLSRDGLPIVGKVPGWQNLFLGTGAGRKGILWSTGMSQGLADMILHGTSEVPGLTFLDPARFQKG
jgi:glycine oxidase